MPDKVWKAGERKLAGYFNTVRNPLSGKNSGVTGSDSRHSQIYFEMKSGRKHWAWNATKKLLGETQTEAMKEDKMPIVVTHQTGRKDYLCFLSLGDLLKMKRIRDLTVCVEAKELAGSLSDPSKPVGE